MAETKKFINHLVASFLLDGFFAILAGVLIFIYPDLLGMMVGIFLIILGVKAMFFAVKIKKTLKTNE